MSSSVQSKSFSVWAEKGIAINTHKNGDDICPGDIVILQKVVWVLLHLSQVQLSKKTLVQGDKCPRDSCPIVQGDFGPRRLLSKEAFTSDKLAQFFFYSVLDVTIVIDYKMTKKNDMNSP